LLMASIPLLGVFLLLITEVLLGGLGVGLLGRLTLSGRRGIGGVLALSVRTGVTGGFLWDFLVVGILGILRGSTSAKNLACPWCVRRHRRPGRQADNFKVHQLDQCRPDARLPASPLGGAISWTNVALTSHSLCLPSGASFH